MSDRQKIEEVFSQVKGWPASARSGLMAALAESLREASAPAGGKPRLEELVGAARGAGPAPSDDQVRQWIGEHRMEKYGR